MRARLVNCASIGRNLPWLITSCRGLQLLDKIADPTLQIERVVIFTKLNKKHEGVKMFLQ